VIAATMADIQHDTRHCCFLVGDDCFAVSSTGVTEVLRDGRITRVPHAAEAVIGLLHLRGRIVPVIDMRRRLGVIGTASNASRTHLVIRLHDDWYSLLVDEMLDVIEVPEHQIEHPSKPSADSANDAVTGVFADDGRLIYFLDPQRIVQPLARQREQFLQRQGAPHGTV
jgi:purine-binding chemotaxis protein CheW